MIVAGREIAPGEVASHYDELDLFYREIWGEHVHHGFWRTGSESRDEAVRQLVERVAAEAEIKPGAEVCDAGCGYGATARMLSAKYGASVTALTISEAQHVFARERACGAENPRFLLRDWMRNDLPSETFDAVIAIESSEHMPSLPGFFNEARRVLRPGGKLVVCSWLSCDRPSSAGVRWLLEPICREGRMPLMGTMGDYRSAAEAAGFVVEKTDDISRQVRGTWTSIVQSFAVKLANDPRYIRFLLNRHARNRLFALTVFRIWLAYRLGTMRYGIVTARAIGVAQSP